MKRRRLTVKGIKIRQTRQRNKITRFVSDLNLGGKDAKALKNFIGQKLRTKKGVERSNRLIELLATRDFKALSRFRAIRDLKKLNQPNFKNIGSLLRADGEFYVANFELVNSYNKLSNKERNNFRNRTRIELEREYASYQKFKQQDG